MKKLAVVFALGMSAALVACATTGDDAEGTCDLVKGQRFEGQKATADSGHDLLLATGAATLRWVPPRTAVTMDYRPNRLTVEYDDDMVITKVSCT